VSDQADAVIAELPGNATEAIRVRPTTFNGIDFVDAGVWTVPAVPGEESKPTKKGLALRPATWAELAEVIRRETGGAGD